jgi:hypothetical protein
VQEGSSAYPPPPSAPPGTHSPTDVHPTIPRVSDRGPAGTPPPPCQGGSHRIFHAGRGGWPGTPLPKYEKCPVFPCRPDALAPCATAGTARSLPTHLWERCRPGPGMAGGFGSNPPMGEGGGFQPVSCQGGRGLVWNPPASFPFVLVRGSSFRQVTPSENAPSGSTSPFQDPRFSNRAPFANRGPFWAFRFGPESIGAPKTG